MATEDEDLGTDQRIRSQVGRTVLNWVVALLSLGLIGGWASTGIYQLEPGEAVVILRLGEYDRTVAQPGLKWLWPAPLEYASRVKIGELRRQEFGTPEEGVLEGGASAIQTVDSNIVNLRYVMTYQIDDAFTFLFKMAEPDDTLHDAAQSAVRQVVGQREIDAVLSAERAAIQLEAKQVLEENLASYFSSAERSPFRINSIQLQVVQPPQQVQQAFDDVVAAQQDEVRAVSEARGSAREVSARAEAQVVELVASAQAYRDSVIAKSRGEANRFSALLVEYQRAPEVTRRRLYLETMEVVMPTVEKLIVEPNTVNMFPVLPTPERQQVATPVTQALPVLRRGAPPAPSAPAVGEAPESAEVKP